MSIGKIICNTKAAILLGFGSKKTAKTVATAVAKMIPQTKGTVRILPNVEVGTPGRILRMQDAKQVFTPYKTKITHESVPTLQKIEEITGVSRGKVTDATGYFDKKRAADALAAFKHEPPIIKYSTYTPNYQPTQKVLDELHDIKKIEALKAYEQSGKLADLPKDVARKRLDAQTVFSRDLF